VAAEPQAPPHLLAFIIILSLAFALVTIFGLLFMVILGTEMMSRHDWPAETKLFMAALFLTTLGADFLLARQISRLLTVYLQSGPRTTPAKPHAVPNASAPRLAPPTAAAQTTVLPTAGPDTNKVPAETGDQEQPTRKL
jgi:hypothetical protein